MEPIVNSVPKISLLEIIWNADSVIVTLHVISTETAKLIIHVDAMNTFLETAVNSVMKRNFAMIELVNAQLNNSMLQQEERFYAIVPLDIWEIRAKVATGTIFVMLMERAILYRIMLQLVHVSKIGMEIGVRLTVHLMSLVMASIVIKERERAIVT